MPTVPVKQLREGMVVGDHVFSRTGQIIIERNTSLTRQMMSRLAYYGIGEVPILSDDEGVPEEVKVALENKKEVQQTHLKKILDTPEYKKFSQDYKEDVVILQNSLNDIIVRNTPVDQPALVNETVKLFDDQSTTYSLFGMLHSMQQIDDSTFAHSLNVSIIGRLIGTWLKYSEEDLDVLTMCGLMHDVGKCRIPPEIISKPGRLTPNEFKLMRMHPQLGYEVLKKQDLDERIKNAALLHHERYDGTGYPFGYKGTQLDDFTCIIGIADVYDAMTSKRSYREPLCPFDVIATFESEGLNKYHPQIIMIFLEKIANSYLNSEVLLSNNKIARIIYINKQLTRPVLQLTDTNEIVNLEEKPELYIQAIV